MEERFRKIREYIATCPFLKDGHIDVNYIGKEIGDYSVEEVQDTSPVVKTFTDGSEIRRILFNLVSREKYEGGTIATNLNTSKFYQDFEEWIKKNNDLKKLPKIRGALKISTKSNGYLVGINDREAVYTIQLEFQYLEED